MTISDNLSGGTPGSTPPPVTPTPSAASGGRPKWLIPVIIGVLVCCLLACAAIALTMGPAIGQAATLATMCVAANPDATQTECQTWVTDIIQNHSADFTACQQTSGGDQDAMYQCLLDAGISPP